MELAMVPTAPQFAAASAVVARLREAGYQAYLAGGSVRDLLLGREPSDYDVATSATPPVVLDLFERAFAGGAHFGVVLVATGGELSPPSEAEGEPEPEEYVLTEVATFR